MKTANTNKLKIKDIITVVLLALINVVIFFASSLLYATPITIILMPVFFALLEGIIYFIIGTKSQKAWCFPHLQRCPCYYGRIFAVYSSVYPLRCYRRAAFVENRLWKRKGTHRKLHHQSSVCCFWKHCDSLRHRRKSHGRAGCVRRPSG